MGELLISPYRCDVTGNPVGTDTIRIGFVCGCQGCRAAAEITRLRADVERLTRERAEAFERAAQIVETAKPERKIISEESWVDFTNDYGEVIGRMKQGERFRLDYRSGIAAAIRQAASGESGT